MTTLTTLVPAAVPVPRGAPVAARLFGALLRAFQRAGADRVAKASRAARVKEAAATRRHAMRHLAHNPRFAEDLLAAAERHERAI
jgi:hypothetical protein